MTLHRGDSERVGPRIVLLGRDLAILAQCIREVVPGLTEGDFVSRGVRRPPERGEFLEFEFGNDVVLTKKLESF